MSDEDQAQSPPPPTHFEAHDLSGQKRARKQIARFTPAQITKPQKITVTQGRGTALRNMERVHNLLTQETDIDFLKQLHRLIFGAPGTKQMRKRHLLDFSGITADEASERTRLHEKALACQSKFVDHCLRVFCLDTALSARKEEKVAALVDFLVLPTPTSKAAKPIQQKKKTADKKRKAASDSRSSKSAKKAKTSSTANTEDHGDSSADESHSDSSDNTTENTKKNTPTKAKTAKKTAKEKDDDESDDNSDDNDDDDNNDGSDKGDGDKNEKDKDDGSDKDSAGDKDSNGDKDNNDDKDKNGDKDSDAGKEDDKQKNSKIDDVDNAGNSGDDKPPPAASGSDTEQNTKNEQDNTITEERIKEEARKVLSLVDKSEVTLKILRGIVEKELGCKFTDAQKEIFKEFIKENL